MPGILIAQILPGSRQIALSHADIAQSDDAFSIFTNPGGMDQIRTRQFGIFYSPSPFGITELQTLYAAYTEPMRVGTMGLGIMHYGFELYNVTEGYLGFSAKLKDNTFAGVSVNFHHLYIENYGSDITFQINAGIVAKILHEVTWGASILNLNRSTIGQDKNVLPTTFTTGFMIVPIEKCNLYVSAQKESGLLPSANFGVSYSPITYFTILSGYSTYPASISAGIALHYSFLEFDYAAFHHEELGYTHQIGLLVDINKLLDVSTGK